MGYYIWSVNPGENTGSPIKSVKSVRHWIVAGQHFGHIVKSTASFLNFFYSTTRVGYIFVKVLFFNMQQR